MPHQILWHVRQAGYTLMALSVFPFALLIALYSLTVFTLREGLPLRTYVQRLRARLYPEPQFMPRGIGGQSEPINRERTAAL